MRILILWVLFMVPYCAESQKTVQFKAEDSLRITAHLYETEEHNPYVLLFHQEGSSKGEYQETAGKIARMGYNVLAVDLRVGDEMNFIQNETVQEAKKFAYPMEMIDVLKDINASMDYAFAKNIEPLILIGSSYSASLSMIAAKGNPKVKAVVAFSPGEYFQPGLTVSEALDDFNKPVFLASSKREFSYLKEIANRISPKYKTLFHPKEGEGMHGSRALWQSCNTNNEYWLALILFFDRLNE